MGRDAALSTFDTPTLRAERHAMIGCVSTDAGRDMSALEQRRQSFFDRWPKAKTLDAGLRTAENPTPLFFLMRNNNHPDLKDVGFAIGRLGPDIERQYLINGEIAFFFAPWRDFQRRSFNAMTLGLQKFSRDQQRHLGAGSRFTPSSRVVILATEDPQAIPKVDEWQEVTQTPTLVIPISIIDDDPVSARLALLSELRSRLGDRDLYRAQNPVTGADFFGRQGLLRQVEAALASDENVALLGLRRSGKTSVLREVRRRLMPRGLILTMGDFQALKTETVNSLARSIARNLIDDLREARDAGVAVRIGDAKEQEVDSVTLPDLSDRIKRVAARNPEIRFVIALDEIEHAARMARDRPDEIRTLLGALRSAAQARPNVTLAFAGVANRMFRTTTLGIGPNRVDNPMFAQVASLYITAFDQEESGNLLRELGRPMFLDWTPEAIYDVHRATGGMPYFVRDLASTVRRSIRSAENTADFATVSITSEHVSRVLPLWREDAAHNWLELIEGLRLHYPEAADLLDPSLSENELDQWIDSDASTKEAAEDLRLLGLLRQPSPGQTWSRTPSLQAIQSLLGDRIPRRQGETADPRSADGLLSLIKGGESQLLEFKETFRVNAHTRQKDERMEAEIVRAVAGLMNAEGGRLIVGVHDSGEIIGLERDLRLFRNDLDRIERWITGDLLGRRIDQGLVAQHVRLWWVELRGARVCALEIQASPEPAWVDDEQLFVRSGNQTIELAGRRLQQFLARK